MTRGAGSMAHAEPATSTIVKPAAQGWSSRKTPVSASNIALFEAAYQAYLERGDLDVFYRALDPDVERRAWNDDGNCHGRDEVMAAIRSALEGGVAVEVPPHVDAGDKLVPMRARCPRSSRRMPKGCFRSWRSVTVRSWRSATSSTETTRWPLRASELTRRTTH
jgi:hypothetical protein